MDGDVAPLSQIAELARRHRALLVVDEAHAPAPRPRRARRESRRPAFTARSTTSPTLGRSGRRSAPDGGSVASAAPMAESCSTRHGTSSSRPPSLTRGRRRRPPPYLSTSGRLVAQLPRRRTETLRAALTAEGLDAGPSTTQILPLIVGEAGTAARIGELALADGVFAQVIRPPTVPAGDLASASGRDVRAQRQDLDRCRRGDRGGGAPAACRWSPRRSEPESGDVERRDRCAVRGCFVTGTDTGAGKTVLAAAIAAALSADGARVLALKPILTGLDDAPDTAWPRDHEVLAAATGADASKVALRAYGPPVSPHLAVELTGVPLEPERLVAEIRAAAAGVRCSRRRGRRRSARAADGGLGRPPARGRGRAAAGDRSTARARHDQPFAADDRGGSRFRARRRGRRVHPVAGRAGGRSSAPTSRRWRRLGAVEVAGLPPVARAGRAELAAAGAALPLERWTASARR